MHSPTRSLTPNNASTSCRNQCGNRGSISSRYLTGLLCLSIIIFLAFLANAAHPANELESSRCYNQGNPLDWTLHNCAGRPSSSEGILIVSAAHKSWTHNHHGVCLAYDRASFLGANSYSLIMEVKKAATFSLGHPGVVYNFKDSNNYDFAYIRTHSNSIWRVRQHGQRRHRVARGHWEHWRVPPRRKMEQPGGQSDGAEQFRRNKPQREEDCQLRNAPSQVCQGRTLDRKRIRKHFPVQKLQDRADTESVIFSSCIFQTNMHGLAAIKFSCPKNVDFIPPDVFVLEA